MNCILYARVSTDKQAEKELSIPAQLQAMRDYAHQHHWVVLEEFIEPGASATTAHRPQLQRLLTLVKDAQPKIDVVLVHKLDRMARSIDDHVAIRTSLKREGVRLASVVENVDESVSGQLIENIMASIAQFYSGNLAEEVRKGMRQKVLKGGWPHRPPRGYMLVRPGSSTTSAIEIHPVDGPLMRRAFELYATGWYSIKALTKRLWKDGLSSRTGQPIPQAHLRRLLENEFYVGLVRWHDMKCPGKHSPLISEDLFTKVQQIIRQRFNNPGPRGTIAAGFPLRGVAICAGCRGRMTSERHGRWQYYRCSRQTYRRELCMARMCNATVAHAGLQRVCSSIRLDRSLADQIAEAATSVIKSRLADVNRRHDWLGQQNAGLLADELKLTAAFRTGDVAPSQFSEQSARIRERRQALTDLQGTVPPTSEALAEHIGRQLKLATSFWDLYASMNDARRSALVRSVFAAVILDHTGIVGFSLQAPFDQLVKNGPKASATDLAKLLLTA